MRDMRTWIRPGRRWPRLAVGLAVAVALGPLVGCGQGDVEGLVVAPEVLDWGRVVRGQTVVRELTLRNASPRAIYVTELKPNCKCVQAAPFQRNLQPGEERRVQVALDATTLPVGELKGKKLDILSDDPLQPHRQADVRATIYVTHTIAPEQRLDVGRLAGDRRLKTWRVLVRPANDAAVRLVRALVTPPGVFEVETEATTDGGWDLVLRVADGAEGQGAFQTTLAMELEIEENDRPTWRAVERIRVDGSW